LPHPLTNPKIPPGIRWPPKSSKQDPQRSWRHSSNATQPAAGPASTRQEPQPTLKSAATHPAGPATSATTASALTYDIYFGTDNPPTTRIAQDLAEPIYDPTPSEGEELDGGTTYYWYALAKSASGNVAGPLWLFTTVPPPTVLLSVESTPITGVSITGDKSGVTNYTAVCITGQNVSLTAPSTVTVGDVTYDFVQWTGHGTANGQNVQVTMDGDKTVTAEYAIRQHTLSVNSTPVTGAAITGDKPGTTDCSVVCEDGETVNLTAPETVIVSAVEYRFVQWIVDGADQPLFQESLELAMDAGHTAVAKYRLAADTNDDCMINVLDLIAVRNHLQESVVINDNWQYDVNDDQMINVLDLLSVRNNLQTMCGN